MAPEIRAKLAKQVADPQHCWLLLDGQLFKHCRGTDDEAYPLQGQPVRFTRLAGESMLAWAAKCGWDALLLDDAEEVAAKQLAGCDGPKFRVGK